MKFKSTLILLSLILAAAIVTDAYAQRPRHPRGRGNRMERRGKDNAPKVGDTAPTFTLKSHDGKSETSLASFRGKKPVVLFFGSYT